MRIRPCFTAWNGTKGFMHSTSNHYQDCSSLGCLQVLSTETTRQKLHKCVKQREHHVTGTTQKQKPPSHASNNQRDHGQNDIRWRPPQWDSHRYLLSTTAVGHIDADPSSLLRTLHQKIASAERRCLLNTTAVGLPSASVEHHRSGTY